MLTYEDSGVSVAKNDELVEMISSNTGVSTGFADYQPIPGTDRFIVQCSDGVGTKIHLATSYWDLHYTIGQDLVAMCVNDLITAGAKPFSFQDYIGMNNLNREIVKVVIQSIRDACESCGVMLTGGEMAEMPGTYVKPIPELVGFATGFAESRHLIRKEDVKEGDLIIALPSSGPHSNGYSLIRRVLYTLVKPQSKEFMKQILAPTIIYSRVAEIHQESPYLINAMAHITGGGLENNLLRAIPDGLRPVIDYSRWDVPEVFTELQEMGHVDPDSMWTTFNMGVGMCLVVSPVNVTDVLDKLDGHHRAFVIGKIEKI